MTPGFASDKQDTTCIPALQLLVKSLSEAGVKLTIFALHYPFRLTKYEWYGIPVYPLNGRNRRLDRLLFMSGRLERCFAGVHQSMPFDAIHAFWLNESTYFSQHLAKKHQLPLIATAMGQDVLQENRYLNQIDWAALKKTITLSAFQQEVLQQSTGVLSELIGFGVEQRTTAVPKQYDLIGVGSLIPLKNYTYFLEICADLALSKPDFTALLVGEGEEYSLLKRRIQELNLEQQITLMGSLPYDMAQELIAASRVLIHPSRYESFSMVMAEALSYGTQVMATPVGIANEHPEVHLLTMDAVVDSATVLNLITIPSPPPVVLSLEACVSQYMSIYNGL